jgi:hypothetical protein
MNRPLDHRRANIAPAAKARAGAILDALVRLPSGVTSWRQFVDNAETLDLATSDAMIDWNRRSFNRMNHREQAEYEARLRARTYFWINGIKVPKIVFDYARERQS